MEFKLFKKLASLEGMELYLLLGAAALFVLLLVIAVLVSRQAPAEKRPVNRTRALVYGALCITLAFVLSYFKLFSMPFGGSITLFSMLPIFVYAAYFGPAAGLLAGLAYALLQVVQGAYIVHWAQFILDYFVAFTILGVAGFFPDRPRLGSAVGGLSRMLVSTISGAIFFADAGLDYGIANPWWYSFLYNGLTIGVDTLLCVLVLCIPAVRSAIGRALVGKRG